MKTRNQAGLAHLGILAVVVGLLVVSVGYRIYHVNSKARLITGTSVSADKKEVKLNNPKQEVVSPKGSAAQATTKNGTKVITAPVTQTVNYDLTTPYGTLKQLETDIRGGNYDAAAYFITPRVLFRASDTMGVPVDGDMSKIYYACTQNNACSLGLASSSLGSNFTTSDYDYPEGGTHGVTIIYNLSDINKPAAAIYGNQQVRIYTVGYDNDSKWVVDKISVGASTF